MQFKLLYLPVILLPPVWSITVLSPHVAVGEVSTNELTLIFSTVIIAYLFASSNSYSLLVREFSNNLIHLRDFVERNACDFAFQEHKLETYVSKKDAPNISKIGNNRDLWGRNIGGKVSLNSEKIRIIHCEPIAKRYWVHSIATPFQEDI